MAKVSVLIPARNERFLVPTVNDVLSKAAGDVEVVAVLEDFGKPDVTPSATDWAKVQAQHGPRLTTIYHHEAKGLRPSVNEAAASAMSRGAKYLFKLDAHCMVDEAWDTKLIADCEPNWVVVPRRKRLDAEHWAITEVNKPDIDYHYLSFPDDPQDFGGAGLNGKVWEQRARERRDKPEYDLDWEMSSQGSSWFTLASYFTQLELMDDASYGTFWNEMQEIGLKAWLSGGQLMVNKRTWYAHLHKGRKYGRGYHLQESLLKQGRNHTMKWLYNEAWAKQTLPFKSLIERFWPVPTWPEDWEERVYGQRSGRLVQGVGDRDGDGVSSVSSRVTVTSPLVIHKAHYGIGVGEGEAIDVTEHLQSLVKDDSLDIVVSNSTLGVGNPFRGKKKTLWVIYRYGDGDGITVSRAEKDWLIIGQARQTVEAVEGGRVVLEPTGATILDDQAQAQVRADVVVSASPLIAGTAQQLYSMSSTALNDYLIRKFQIPAQRLRGPMPIEVPSFHRNDLAQLFAELGFNRGAEIGVAEGKFSEVICKANPELRLLCVDPWHSYKGNPQSKTKEKDEFAYREAQRRLAPYPNVKLDMRLSMDAVRDVEDGSLDFVNIDGHHGFRYAMLDLLCWSMKVRTGGIILLDDYIYLDRKRWGAGVVEAVQAFTSANEINPWFICNADRSIDAFFVKGDWK